MPAPCLQGVRGDHEEFKPVPSDEAPASRVVAAWGYLGEPRCGVQHACDGERAVWHRQGACVRACMRAAVLRCPASKLTAPHILQDWTRSSIAPTTIFGELLLLVLLLLVFARPMLLHQCQVPQRSSRHAGPCCTVLRCAAKLFLPQKTRSAAARRSSAATLATTCCLWLEAHRIILHCAALQVFLRHICRLALLRCPSWGCEECHNPLG